MQQYNTTTHSTILHEPPLDYHSSEQRYNTPRAYHSTTALPAAVQYITSLRDIDILSLQPMIHALSHSRSHMYSSESSAYTGFHDLGFII